MIARVVLPVREFNKQYNPSLSFLSALPIPSYLDDYFRCYRPLDSKGKYVEYVVNDDLSVVVEIIRNKKILWSYKFFEVVFSPIDFYCILHCTGLLILPKDMEKFMEIWHKYKILGCKLIAVNNGVRAELAYCELIKLENCTIPKAQDVKIFKLFLHRI